MGENEERKELRIQQAALQKRTAELELELQRLHNSNDRVALRALQEQIKLHEEELKAFEERLSAFHAAVGPIGSDEKDRS